MNFAYSELRLSKTPVSGGESVSVTCRVSNQGSLAAEEVVQVYLADLEATVPVPLQRLVAFRRLRLWPGGSRRVTFRLDPQMLSLVDEAGERRLEPGLFRVTIGGCSPGPRGQALGAPPPVSATFSLV